MAKSGTEQQNIFGQSISFVQEANSELKKVHFPNRQETIQATILVLLMVAFFALFLGLADLLVGKLMGHVLT